MQHGDINDDFQENMETILPSRSFGVLTRVQTGFMSAVFVLIFLVHRTAHNAKKLVHKRIKTFYFSPKSIKTA